MIVIPAVVPDQLLLPRFNYLSQTECLLYHQDRRPRPPRPPRKPARRRARATELSVKVEGVKEPAAAVEIAEKKEPGAVVEDVAADKGKLRKVQFGRNEETSDGGRVRKKANANKYTHEIALIMRGPSGDSK